MVKEKAKGKPKRKIGLISSNFEDPEEIDDFEDEDPYTSTVKPSGYEYDAKPGRHCVLRSI